MSGLGFGFGSVLSAFGVSPVTSPRMAWAGSATESITIDDVEARSIITSRSAADAVGLNAVVEVRRAVYATLVETVSTDQVVTALRGIVLLERLRVADSSRPNQRANLDADETISLADVLAIGRLVDVAETLTLSATLAAQQAVYVIEALGLTETVTAAAKYGRSLIESVQIAAELARFFGAEAAETLQITDSGTVRLKASAALSEAVAISDTISRQLLVRIVAVEGVTVSADEALQAIYHAQLREDIELSIGYLAPDGSFLTWAMNTRTGATSEYSNYAFNSFARIGNRYVGANDSGLYDLTGDADAGDQIIAALKGGFMQFGGTHLSRLKEAYIAATGDESTFVLKIETLDGATYTYQVDTRSGRNTKVHMGKGMRARYFAYELTSTGQDFTLDTLEFVPITVQRRV